VNIEIEETPSLPHLSTEFFVWLWYASDRDGGTMELPGHVGVVDVWVDQRLAFSAIDGEGARAVVTGENTASSLEARAALAGGKVVRDVQLHLRRESREYTVTLKGVHLDLAGVKFPPHTGDGDDGLLYERMYLYEDLWFTLEGLYRRFAEERTSPGWKETLACIRGWVDGDLPPDSATNEAEIESVEQADNLA